MTSLRRIVSRAIAESVAMARATGTPRHGLRVLMYHAVGSPAAGDTRGIYSIRADLFERQIAALADFSASPVTALAAGIGAEDGLRIAVTFDDGYRDNLTLAAPLLQQHGIPFTVFVCTAFMRQATGNFLTRADVHTLAALPGVTIGSHGATHVPLNGLDDRALRDELMASKAELEDASGRAVTAISYPHGAVDRRVRDAAAAAGYTVGACSRFDVNDAARDPLLLCRTDIHGDDSVRVFRQKLHGDWDWYRWRNPDPAMS